MDARLILWPRVRDGRAALIRILAIRSLLCCASFAFPPNVLTLSCAARTRVPEPERRGGCRREVALQRLPICNRRDAVTLATMQPARPASRSRAATASAVKLGGLPRLPFLPVHDRIRPIPQDDAPT